MLKQRPVIYLALLATSGGLFVAGVPGNRVLLIGVFAFMLMMHLGGHGGHGTHGGHGGHGGHGRAAHEGHGTNQDPVAHGHVAPAPKEDAVAGK